MDFLNIQLIKVNDFHIFYCIVNLFKMHIGGISIVSFSRNLRNVIKDFILFENFLFAGAL